MSHEIKFEDFEYQVMTKFLKGDESVLAHLRKQYAKTYVKKREFTSMGFYTEFSYKESVEPLENFKDFSIGDVAGTVNNEGINLDLFIENGTITALKGTIFGTPWPKHIYTLDLEYWGDNGKRNMELLRSSWLNINNQIVIYDTHNKRLTIKK